jgi:hypothetical protein
LSGGLLRRCDRRHLLKRMLRGLGHDSEEASPCYFYLSSRRGGRNWISSDVARTAEPR